MPKINTYTDNATIEDVDAVLTYDPAGSGATKLTTFGRIATWVSTKLAGLAKKTTISSADQILMVNGSAANRIDYNVLAKAILEEYAASTLAGSAQSVQSALNVVKNATIPQALANNTDLNTVTKKGHYYCNSTANTYTNSPVRGTGFTLEVLSKGGTKNQVLIATTGKMYYRAQGASAWGTWKTISNLLSVDSKTDFLAQITNLETNEAAVFYGYGEFSTEMTNGALTSVCRGIVSRTTAGVYDFSFSAYPHRFFTGRYQVAEDIFSYEEFLKQEHYGFGNTAGTKEWTLSAGTCYLMIIHRMGVSTKKAGMYIISANTNGSSIQTVVEPEGFTPSITLDKLSLTVDTGSETYVKVGFVKIS